MGIDCDPYYHENDDPICFREYLLDHYGDVWNDKYRDCGPGKCFDMHDDDRNGTGVGDDDNDTDTDYGDSCFSEALEYIDTHLLADFSNACEVYDYVMEHFNCLDEDQEDDTLDDHEDTEDDWEDDGGNDGDPVEEEYNEEQRKPIWWYHSDHLGSSSYITDNFGRPSHYYEYLPFGELMTEHNQSKYYLEPYPTQNMDSYNNPYKFNGKEMDRETGMYYYGARYYDPRISIFVSVDPLAEEFPNFGGYVYTMNNPAMFIDPDGKAPESVIIIFNKSTNKLAITDLDHYKKGLPTKVVKAKDYIHGGIRDRDGNLTHNQILIIEKVFSGGQASNGNITRNLNSDPKQLPIPNGNYDLLEYEGNNSWYKVDPIDEIRYDDHHQGETNSNGKIRNGYRLHMGSLSHGCITCDNSEESRQDEWNVLGTILENTSKTSVPKREGNQKHIPFTFRKKYGEIRVKGTDSNIKEGN